MDNYNELSARAQRGELCVKPGTIRRGSEASAEARALLEEAAGITNLEEMADAVHLGNETSEGETVSDVSDSHDNDLTPAEQAYYAALSASLMSDNWQPSSHMLVGTEVRKASADFLASLTFASDAAESEHEQRNSDDR